MTRKCIMISGPHGIGKTTTAKEISKKIGYMFIGSVAGIIAKKMKFDIDKNFNPLDIIKYQHEILKASEFIFDSTALVEIVCDRSPLDWAVYLTLALEDEQGFEETIKEYRELCVSFINKTCSVLVIPEADLSEAYEDKHGRPTFTAGQIDYRRRYSAALDELVSSISSDIKVIRVPMEHQYEARTSFILEQLVKV